MSRITIEITGASPLLCSRFTEAAAAQTSSGSSSSITIGQRGTPREQAEIRIYKSADGRPMIPGPNVFRGLIDAGAFHKAGRRMITTGRSSLVPAGIQVEEQECFIVNPFKKESAQWEVDSRSVVMPATGGRFMCHRPRFDSWRIGFTLIVDEKMFDQLIVRALVDDLGTKVGLGDFRPARKGPFGRFHVTEWNVQLDAHRKPSVQVA